MNCMKKISLLSLLVIAVQFNSQVYANVHDAPNPADLTQANTYLSLQGGVDKNDKFINAVGGISGQYSKGNTFLGSFEHRLSTDGDSLYTRGRYFQVLDVESTLFPQLGFSVDYNKGYGKDEFADTDTLALGVIAKLDVGSDWLTLYPNIGVVAIEHGDVTSRGIIANLFLSIALSEQGHYLMLQPQSTLTQDINIIKFDVVYGAPLNNEGTLWWDAKLGYTKTTVDSKYLDHKLNDDNTEFTVGINYYF